MIEHTVKNTNDGRIIIFNFLNVSNCGWKVHVLKIKFFYKIFVSFLILLGLWFAGCKYLTKHHLKNCFTKGLSESLLAPIIA